MEGSYLLLAVNGSSVSDVFRMTLNRFDVFLLLTGGILSSFFINPEL